MRPWFLLALAITGCETPSTATTPQRQPQPDVTAPVAAGPCVLEYGLQVSQSGDWIAAIATVTNHDATAHVVTITDRCPGQDVTLLGLPFGHDADETCDMGACPTTDEPTRTAVIVPAGESVQLGGWSLSTQATPCNDAMPPGTYELSLDTAVLAPDATACGPVVAAIVVPDADPAPDPTVKCAPMPACGIGCPGPMAKDENGCTLCACEEDPFDSLRP